MLRPNTWPLDGAQRRRSRTQIPHTSSRCKGRISRLSNSKRKWKMTAKTKRKAVLKVKIEAIHFVDLKDSKSVMQATANFEAAKEKMIDLGFRILADMSAF